MIAAHDDYDRQAGTWHNAAPLPLPRDHLAVVAADRRIRVIGGQRPRASQQILRPEIGTKRTRRLCENMLQAFAAMEKGSTSMAAAMLLGLG
jgi:hypothetical protein